MSVCVHHICHLALVWSNDCIVQTHPRLDKLYIHLVDTHTGRQYRDCVM